MDIAKLSNFRKKLRQLEREIEDQLKYQTDCCGVSMAQCHALLEIGELDQISIGDIADFLNLDKSTLSRTIDNLVKLGLVNRVINPEDRRYMKVNLTEQGKKVYDEINNQCNNYYQEMFNFIPEDKHKQVLESLALLVDAMLKLKQTQNPNTDETNSCCTSSPE
jgi:DNA-binding MarR family transcriptional regulator